LAPPVGEREREERGGRWWAGAARLGQDGPEVLKAAAEENKTKKRKEEDVGWATGRIGLVRFVFFLFFFSNPF
jgi:hypothetical protein